MNITCPIDGDGLVYAIRFSASGGYGTMSANGNVRGTSEKDKDSVDEVRLLVKPGNLMGTSPPLPNAGDPGVKVITSFSGANWCADGVLVLPPLSGSGSGGSTSLTMLGFSLLLGLQVGNAAINPFQARATVGSFCSGCGSGSSSGGGSGSETILAAALTGAQALEVTIPDGPQAGIHKADLVAALHWTLRLGGMIYHITPCRRRGLVIRAGATEIVGAVAYEPFLATFPGNLFATTEEVVVMLA